MNLILTRHGETIENSKGITQGHLHGELSKKGIEQAKKLALKLRGKKIDFVYSSDLKRAKDTTKEIIQFHSKVPIIYTNLLREKNHGEFNGKNKEEIEKIILNKNLDFANPKQGESIKQFVKRVKSFFDIIINKHKQDTILLVSHGGTLLNIMSFITNKNFGEIAENNYLNNACLYEYKLN